MPPKKEVQLWDRTSRLERQRAMHRTDPEFKKTIDVFRQSKRYGKMTKRDDGLFSDIVTLYDWKAASKGRGTVSTLSYAEAHVPTLDSDIINIALSSGKDNAGKPIDLESYQMNRQGVIVDLDNMDIPIEVGSDEYNRVMKALGEIRDNEQRQIENAQWDRRALRRRLIVGGVAVTAVSGAAFGVWTLVNNLIIIPNAQAQAYREEYDQTDHSLPGEGAQFDYHEFETMPVGEFNDIPAYGGDDENFLQPRTVELGETDGCIIIKTDFDVTDELYVALPADSQYSGYHYGTGVNDDGFSVCIAEDAPSDGYGEAIEVAIQVR